MVARAVARVHRVVARAVARVPRMVLRCCYVVARVLGWLLGLLLSGC